MKNLSYTYISHLKFSIKLVFLNMNSIKVSCKNQNQLQSIELNCMLPLLCCLPFFIVALPGKTINTVDLKSSDSFNLIAWDKCPSPSRTAMLKPHALFQPHFSSLQATTQWIYIFKISAPSIVQIYFLEKEA